MPHTWSLRAPRLFAGLAALAIISSTVLFGASAPWQGTPSADAAGVRYAHHCGHHRHHHHHRRHHRRRHCVRARSGVRAASGTSSTPTPPPPGDPVSPDFYGVNAQALNPSFMPSSQWGPHLSGIRDAGFSSVRREILWNTIEPNAPSGGVHDYHWQTADAFIADLASHNLRWYGSVGRGTSWASGAWNRPPTDQHISDYAAFAGALAARYGDNGTFWQQHPELPYMPVRDFEIWNEPDYQVFWIDDMSDAPARYGRMVAAASTAIHNADPQGQVAVGALAPSGANDFLAQMVQANPGLRGQVSTVSFHPYGHTAQRSLDRIAALRHTIDQWLGSDVNMEITEEGIALTPSTSFTEADRADLWRKLALTLPRTDCRITSFLPLDWTGQKGDPTKPNRWYGMADWNTAQLDSSGEALKQAMLREEGLGSTPPAGGKVNVCYG